MNTTDRAAQVRRILTEGDTPSAPDATFDTDAAVAAYEANPAQFERDLDARDADQWGEATPAEVAARALILNDGPWWVPDFDDAEVSR